MTLRDVQDRCGKCRAAPGDPCVTAAGNPTTPHALPRVGAVEKQVRADIAALVTAHPMGESLAEMSYNLARSLDNGAGLAVAAVNRELRANLVELSRLSTDSGDLSDAFSTPDAPEQGK